MADTPAQQAAAGVLEDAMGDQEVLLDHQAMDGEIFGNAAPLQPEPFLPSEQVNEAPIEGEQPQDELEIPEISWETPEELREVLEAPDFDEEDDEPAYTQAETQEWNEDELDPEKVALRKQIAKLEKKAAWAEEQKVKASRKTWEAEARKYFQFSNPELIQANSRRAFLKQAQAQHEAVAKVAKPVFDQLAEIKAKAKAEALAEARAEAEAAWGRPTAGPQAGTTLQDTQRMQRERLSHGRGLADVLKAKFRNGEVKI